MSAKWKAIQRAIGVDDDGKPGDKTADAVASRLGVSFDDDDTLPPSIEVNQAGLDLIRHFESCLEPTGRGTFRAYPYTAHGWAVPTIGWGTIKYPDGSKVKKGDVISQTRANELLAWEVGEKARGVRKLLKIQVNPDQFAALVSFAYNCGLANLAKSTLLKCVNAGAFAQAADEFLKWDKAGGRVLAGLTRRRKSERRLFLSVHPALIR
jgi:lysozyme